MRILRAAVFVCLAAVFIYQIWTSVGKVLALELVTVTGLYTAEKYRAPSVTVCFGLNEHVGNFSALYDKFEGARLENVLPVVEIGDFYG